MKLEESGGLLLLFLRLLPWFLIATLVFHLLVAWRDVFRSFRSDARVLLLKVQILFRLLFDAPLILLLLLLGWSWRLPDVWVSLRRVFILANTVILLMTCILELILHFFWHIVMLEWLKSAKSLDTRWVLALLIISREL